MVIRIVIISILMSTMVCGCNEKENNKIERYPNGNVKSIVSLIEEGGEETILFNEEGDTIEVSKSRGVHLCRALYGKDTISYRFYLNTKKRFVYEYLTSLRKTKETIIPETSYVYMVNKKDSVFFNYIGPENDKFRIVLFEASDSTLSYGDTIESVNHRNILLPDHQVTDKKILGIVDEISNVNRDYYDIIRREIYINVDAKREFQDFYHLPPAGVGL